MGISAGPKITTDGLVLHIDSSNTKSYSGSGITIYNMVTGGIAGTLVNGPVSDVAYKKTFILDGTNDNIQMQLPSGIVTGSQISISLWAKWKSTGTTTATIQTLVDNQYQVADNIGFFIQDRPDLGSVLEWTTQPNNAINRRVYSTQIVGDGSWHHIVGTNDGTYSRLYVDGYETGTAKTSAGIATTQDMLCIGNWAYVYSSPRYLNGSVSNFKVYNRALSSTEILTDYFSTKNRFFPNENIVRNGLVLNIDASKSNSYPGAGNTIYDLSGSGINGTFVNSPSFNPANGGQINMPGASKYIDLGQNFNFTSENFSISTWVYLDSFVTIDNAGQGPILFFKGDYQQMGYFSQIALDGSFGLYTNQGGVTQGSTTSSGILTTSTWYNLSYVRNGSSVKLYLNGIDRTSVAGTHLNPFSSNQTFKINYYKIDYLISAQMRISQFLLHNRALSATEIQQNFNAMRERYNI
jgi:hypothetical protein